MNCRISSTSGGRTTATAKSMTRSIRIPTRVTPTARPQPRFSVAATGVSSAMASSTEITIRKSSNWSLTRAQRRTMTETTLTMVTTGTWRSIRCRGVSSVSVFRIFRVGHFKRRARSCPARGRLARVMLPRGA